MLEVRDTSAVVLWEPPAFDGRTPVNGYYLDVKEASTGEKGWKAGHEKANKMKYMKVRKIGSSLNVVLLQLRSDVCEIMRKYVFFLTISPFDSSCADSDDRAQGWYSLRLPCARSKSRWSWKVLSRPRSNPGPDSPW